MNIDMPNKIFNIMTNAFLKAWNPDFELCIVLQTLRRAKKTTRLPV